MTTFHPGDNTLRNIIKSNWEVLQRSSATKDISEDKPVFGTRRLLNLRNMLVSAKIRHSKKPDRTHTLPPHQQFLQDQELQILPHHRHLRHLNQVQHTHNILLKT